MTQNVKYVVFVPSADADKVREAIGRVGAGRIGNYGFCSYSTRGQGRFLPLAGAKPAIGKVGAPEIVEEERIEVLVPRALLAKVIEAVAKVHPYEEIAYDIYPVE